MSLSLGSLLSMGSTALNASQAGIQVTGNNISNVNTPGYSRQAVALKEAPGIDSSPGQIGQGVRATEIYRYFDKFIERSYLNKASSESRYNTEYSMLRNVETLFNEASVSGISSALTSMFSSWNILAQEPGSSASREALLQTSNTLASAIRNTDASLDALQRQMNSLISQDVDQANLLLKDIASLNREINAHAVAGSNNPNSLLDARDLKVRELAKLIDVTVQDGGAGHYMVSTRSGLLLVQDDIPFALQFGGTQVEANLGVNSAYKGKVDFDGTDGYEYTMKITRPGSVDTSGAMPPPAATAMYTVSLDGGKTWIQDESGNPKQFYATDKDHSISVKDLSISFTAGSGLAVGDSFTLSPKTEVYWVSPTRGAINVSTQIFGDGSDNNQRLTGGSIAGYLAFRDYEVGQYRDRLDALAQTITWEVNRLHSQGSGLEKLTSALGAQRVGRDDVPLGSPSAAFPWSNRLQEGNVSFAVYDTVTGEPVVPYPGIEAFSPANFDPSAHSLNDIVHMINTGPANSYLHAEIVDNRLHVTAKEGFSFGITNDTTGLAAALGINTFFSGSSAADMGIRNEVLANTNLINAGRINGSGEGNTGDNITAKDIAALTSKSLSITFGSSTTKQNITDFYAAIVSKVGSDTARAKFTYISEATMAQELDDRREALSGVNLDEEMTNLIKFQASYKAAAKLITTADQMLQTLLSLKQ